MKAHSERDYAAFSRAAENGHLAALDLLIESEAPDHIQEMIAANDYTVFCSAAANGHFEVIKRFMELMSTHIQDMISADNYNAFRWAASNGHLEVMEYLISLVEPDQLEAMIIADEFHAFQGAASNGHFLVMERLMKLAPAQIQAMISANDYAAFYVAAANGHLNVMEGLIELVPEQVQAMMAGNDYGAFRSVVQEGRVDIMERILGLVTAEKAQDMIAAGDYAAFRSAAQEGRLALMECFIELAPMQVQAMIVAQDYDAFRSAIQGGHRVVMERLIELAPAEMQAMVTAYDYAAFLSAAQAGHLDIVERLIELMPDQVQTMIAASDYAAVSLAISENHLPVLNRLLSYPSVFFYAESVYGQNTIPFVSQKIEALRAQKIEIEAGDPNAIFDLINPEEARLHFYMLRHLIRRNDPALLEDMHFLLEIPAVKNLAHREVTPHVENELFREAVLNGNQLAAELLLRIPSVRTLAEQNNYYRYEPQGHINLRTLAQDTESSMHALSTGEKKRFQAIIDRYQPLIEQAGIENIMTQLKETMGERYKKEPATIEGVESKLTLPLNWQEFQQLELSLSERKEALKAYYQHEDHSAWRYLLKPNPWMHEHALYANENPENPNEKWSTFEDYQLMIGLLFLAAQDEGAPPSEGHTLETRLEHFIGELARIGRAHNWDDRRERRDKKNHIILDKMGKPIMEEFDNLEGDRPSCYAGVKQRLFHSVLGHPLLNILTKEIIVEEIRDFSFEHFQELINEDNRSLLLKAWEDYAMTMEDSPLQILKILDINPAKQEAFIHYLKKKYGPQFSEEIEFKKILANFFEFTEDNKEAHALLLGGSLVDLSGLLERPKLGIAAAISKAGMYSMEKKEEKLPSPEAPREDPYSL